MKTYMINLILFCFLIGCIQVVAPGDYYNPPEKSDAPDTKTSSEKKPPEIPAKPHPGRNGPLTEKEMELVKVAWKYFENNYQSKTGLVNAVQGYPNTTLWDTASYLGGLVAVYELGVIPKNEFDTRLSALIATFNNMKFFKNEMPNKGYHTQTAKKVNYANKPGEIGFSAIDIGRFLIWMNIIKNRYHEHANSIDNIILKWDFRRVINEYGTMYGAFKRNDKVIYVQEGRLGYEEYAAKGFQLWGFDTTLSSKPEPYTVIPMFGVNVPYDVRDPRELVTHNYVVCESYVLDGMEMNWDDGFDRKDDDMHHSDPQIAEFAQRIYQVQANRYWETGIFTARTEHQLDQPPYFVYDTIYTDGYPWNTITDPGEHVPRFAAVALKGAFGLWTLWDTEYTDRLFELISGLYDPEKGFYEGRYENSGAPVRIFTANNNGIILESFLYKVQGKLMKFSKHPSLWEKNLKDVFSENNKNRGRPGYREQREIPDSL